MVSLLFSYIFLGFFKSHTKNGPPSIAVIIPTGISVGAMIILASVSHKTRKLAPKNMDAGNNILRSGPTISHTICGTISPTNPIGPLMATTVPVKREAITNPIF